VREDVEQWAAENVEQLELLRSTEHFRKEFLQNLSHEFKTPVFAIQGYVEILISNAPIEPDARKKYLSKIAKNIERLNHLLADLDEISSLERGELKLSRENFVIQELIRDVYESFSAIAEAKKIHLQIKKGCESPLTVFADKQKMRQVFANLIENSIKYGKQNGSITASIYKTDDKQILIEISDDGIGVEEKNIARIFERFFRTEEGRSLDKNGSGLGLAICKHIIEAHGQSIHVRSKLNVGTTIGFTIDAKNN